MIQLATIVLNSSCNQSCVWCYNMTKWHNSLQMTKGTFDIVLTKLVEEGCQKLIFVGGEPTIHPQLPQFILRALETGISKVWIVSNGYLIPKDFFSVLEGCQSNVIVNVSIHGSNKAIHDKLTQKQGGFDAIVSNIGTYQRYGFSVNAQTTLCRSNQNDILNILTFIAGFNINNILISYCMKPIGIEVNSSEFITIHEFCESISGAVNNYTGGVRIDVAPYMPMCMTTTSFRELIGNKQINSNYGCGLNNNEVIFDSSGNILLCTHLPDLIMGNINDISDFPSFIKEMNEKVSSYRRYPMQTCTDCNKISDCYGGGCPILWLTNRHLSNNNE